MTANPELFCSCWLLISVLIFQAESIGQPHYWWLGNLVWWIVLGNDSDCWAWKRLRMCLRELWEVKIVNRKTKDLNITLMYCTVSLCKRLAIFSTYRMHNCEFGIWIIFSSRKPKRLKAWGGWKTFLFFSYLPFKGV